jgi:hypothetical protein
MNPNNEMILISHRGNIDGKNEARENHPDYITQAIGYGWDVEIDVWAIEGLLFLGHDEPQYGVSQDWLNERYEHLWIHCKNVEAMEHFNGQFGSAFNYFWHETDTVTLTSKNYVWAYPGKQPIKDSIAVMPEIHNDNTLLCKGICSDYIYRYK